MKIKYLCNKKKFMKLITFSDVSTRPCNSVWSSAIPDCRHRCAMMRPTFLTALMSVVEKRCCLMAHSLVEAETTVLPVKCSTRAVTWRWVHSRNNLLRWDEEGGWWIFKSRWKITSLLFTLNEYKVYKNQANLYKNTCLHVSE